jgi:hypothetical protein
VQGTLAKDKGPGKGKRESRGTALPGKRRLVGGRFKLPVSGADP